MQKPSKAEAIMDRGGIARVRQTLDALETDDHPERWFAREPCEYGHRNCSRVEHGPCSDELMSILENQQGRPRT